MSRFFENEREKKMKNAVQNFTDAHIRTNVHAMKMKWVQIKMDEKERGKTSTNLTEMN